MLDRAAEPAYGPWRSSRIGGGGYLVNGLFTTDPDVMYWYSDVGGVYRSDTAGRSWRQINGTSDAPAFANVRSLLVDPRDPDHLIAATGWQWGEREGIMLSNDAGETWRLVQPAQFYGNEGNRHHGVTLARHPDRPDTVLAASSVDGLFRSQDNGETWEHLGLNGLFVSDLVIDARRPDRVWLSSVDAEPPALYNAEIAEAFYRSEDGGTTWTKLADHAPDEIVQHPTQPETLVGIFDQSLVMISDDAGATWRPFGEGLLQDAAAAKQYGESSGHTFLALAAGPDFFVTAAGDGTFYRRGLSDPTWRQLATPTVNGGDWYGRDPIGDWSRFGRAASSIVIDPDDPDRWFFGDWYAVYETRDAGRSWTLRVDGIELTVIHTLRQDPDGRPLVHLGMGDNGYFRTTDGGEQFVETSDRTNNVKSIDVSPVQPDRVYATGTTTGHWRAHELLASDDGGKSWRVAPASGLPAMGERNMNTVAVDPRDPSRLYVTVSGPTNPNDGGVYRSDDGGETFAYSGDGLPTGEGLFKEQIWESGRMLAIGGGGEQVLLAQEPKRVFQRPDSESAWIEVDIDLVGQPYDVKADPHEPGRFFIADTEAGVWSSDNGGSAWQRVFDRPARIVSFHVERPGLVAVALERDRGVVVSRDGGVTWTALSDRLPNRHINALAFDKERLMVGTAGNGVFWITLD
ncbi:MAG: hypothetical protein AAFY08_00170 [Planctomycetota bacterium]